MVVLFFFGDVDRHDEWFVSSFVVVALPLAPHFRWQTCWAFGAGGDGMAVVHVL